MRTCDVGYRNARQYRNIARYGTTKVTEVFGSPLGSWTSAPSGHGCPRPKACFSTILSALTEVLGRDIRANDFRMPPGYPSQKLPLWADFSFLNLELMPPKSEFAENVLCNRSCNCFWERHEQRCLLSATPTNSPTMIWCIGGVSIQQMALCDQICLHLKFRKPFLL